MSWLTPASPTNVDYRSIRRIFPGSTRTSRAIEISDGVVRNPAILSFQDRDGAYPHPVRVS
ncbi:MAG: hypothetical protein KDB44_12150 [Mycobacterium sp.]|nr:hypothetical protein [Mycobacterium sp.]